MKPKLIVSSLFVVFSLFSSAADLPKLLTSVSNFQNAYTSKENIAAILAVAKSEDYEALVVQCMVVYTLYAGSIGDAQTCQRGFQSICSRYPASDSVIYLRELHLFPQPCTTCLGIGTIQQKSAQGCLPCKSSGVCAGCAGKGRIAGKAGLRGPVRIGTWYTKTSVYHDGESSTERTAIANFGNGQATEAERLDSRCPVCSGTGKCRSCKGSPLTSVLYNSQCPFCDGKPKEINTKMAKAGLVGATKALAESLQLAVACESAYEKALLERDPYKQLDALNVCLASHGKAFNIDVVRDAKTDLEKDVIAFKKLHGIEESAREAKKVQQEKQKRQHEEILFAIQDSKVPRVALEQIQSFIADNPDSPVIVKAKLLLAETEQRIADDLSIAQRNRYIFFGVAALAGLAGIGWLLSCINFAKKVHITKIELIPPSRWPAPPEKTKIPFKPRNEAAIAPPLILQRATANTSNENIVECPECGALVECPSSVHNKLVICASCQKAFNVL